MASTCYPFSRYQANSDIAVMLSWYSTGCGWLGSSGSWYERRGSWGGDSRKCAPMSNGSAGSMDTNSERGNVAGGGFLSLISNVGD